MRRQIQTGTTQWRLALRSRSDFDTVASSALRHVERFVGLVHQLREIRHTLSLEPRNAETRGHLNGFRPKRKVMFAKLPQNTRHDDSHVAFVSMSKNNDEFLTASPAADVRIPHTSFEDSRKLLENCVSRVVTIRIIHSFEVIQISDHHPE